MIGTICTIIVSVLVLVALLCFLLAMACNRSAKKIRKDTYGKTSWPTTVCICGNLRLGAELFRVVKEQKTEGRVVLPLASGGELLHQISTADIVCVVSKFKDKSTIRALRRAKKLKKEIVYSGTV